MPSGYKPSPLGYGSQRSSPFRRRDSIASNSGPLRQTTPLSPTAKAENESTSRPQVERTPSADTSTPSSWTPKARADEMPRAQTSPTRGAPISNSMAAHGNALSQLQPSQVRNLRDGFQILDRDSDGVVNREDVADMLNQLGRIPYSPQAPSQ